MRRRQWDKHEIKAEVARRGSTLTGIAMVAGLEPSACRVALCRRNIQGEQALADFLGVDLAVLWPQRYPVTTSSTKSSAGGGGGTSQNVRRVADQAVAA
ncbi:helix-turn-helix domain-containing protein [Xanthobacter sp. 126]|uniref:helix-turn-helix domain-containing protein n=1 Tax=Xanthobacter sp. 126 TaxID=1131814 RepID=UPI00045EAA17|nr:helix-turn-helix domain-containing protein [Xanthobacter sp. 126]